MRALVVGLFLAIAVPCHAEDPLESLNTLEDTLSAVRSLKQRGERARTPARGDEPGVRLPLDDSLYFVSDREPGEPGWVAVEPCTEELAAVRAEAGADSCVGRPDGSVSMGPYFWKSRPAKPRDLRVGTYVVSRREIGDNGWVLTRITDLSELNRGFVAVAAPFRAAVRGLRVIEQP